VVDVIIRESSPLAANGGLWVARMQPISKKEKWLMTVEKSHHHFAQFVVLDGLSDIVIEARTCGILDLLCHCIG